MEAEQVSMYVFSGQPYAIATEYRHHILYGGLISRRKFSRINFSQMNFQRWNHTELIKYYWF